MRIRFLIALLLCLALTLATGCNVPLAFPPDETAAPSPEGVEVSATPEPAEPTPSPAPAKPESLRSFPLCAIAKDTAYWCTRYGVLELKASGETKIFNKTLGRCPLVMDEYLYFIEDETDMTEDVAWPVPPEAATASKIIRVPLSGGDAAEIYKTAYINAMSAQDGRLYFSTTQGEGLQDAGGMFSIATEGGDEKLLAEDCLQLCSVQKGYTYYMGVIDDASALFRMPLEGGEGELLLDNSGMPLTPLAYEGSVYYVYLNWAEEENRFAVMKVQDGKSEALSEGVTAQELLGIWDGWLYYLSTPGEDGLTAELSRINLTSLEKETVQDGIMQVAALSDDYAAFSDIVAIVVAPELKLVPTSSGETVALVIEDVVEGQG